jgi:ProP effector
MSKVRIELARMIEVIAMLAERWPACFSVFEKRRRPVKIGIDRDLAAALGDVITADELKAALSCYVSNIGYLDNCFIGAERIDLDGNVVGSVSAEQAVRAAAYVSRRIRRRAAAKAIRPHAVAKAPTPSAAAPPPRGRLSLADLKAAAATRRQVVPHMLPTSLASPVGRGDAARRR